MKLPLGKIAELIRAEGVFDGAAHAEGYSIDSRTVRPGELFFAVKGERLDGHEYVDAALTAGAAGAVVRKDFDVAPGVRARRGDAQHRNLLRVDDTLAALQ